MVLLQTTDNMLKNIDMASPEYLSQERAESIRQIKQIRTEIDQFMELKPERLIKKMDKYLGSVISVLQQQTGKDRPIFLEADNLLGAYDCLVKLNRIVEKQPGVDSKGQMVIE